MNTNGGKYKLPVITSLIPKINCNRHTPRRIVFGPQKYVGMGIIPLYSLHAWETSRKIAYHIRRQYSIATLILASIDHLYLQIVKDKAIFTYSPVHLYVTPNIWIGAVWSAMYRLNIKIHISDCLQINPQRK